MKENADRKGPVLVLMLTLVQKTKDYGFQSFVRMLMMERTHLTKDYSFRMFVLLLVMDLVHKMGSCSSQNLVLVLMMEHVLVMRYQSPPIFVQVMLMELVHTTEDHDSQSLVVQVKKIADLKGHVLVIMKHLQTIGDRSSQNLVPVLITKLVHMTRNHDSQSLVVRVKDIALRKGLVPVMLQVVHEKKAVDLERLVQAVWGVSYLSRNRVNLIEEGLRHRRRSHYDLYTCHRLGELYRIRPYGFCMSRRPFGVGIE